jgi:hypothetical protein
MSAQSAQRTVVKVATVNLPAAPNLKEKITIARTGKVTRGVF